MHICWMQPNANINTLDIGDIVQLSFNGTTFSHTLIVIKNGLSVYDTLIAAHTDDVFGKSVAQYNFQKYRCIHINS